jgi:hypothetical protein
VVSDLRERRLRVDTSGLAHRRAVRSKETRKHPTQEFCRVFAAGTVAVVDTEEESVSAALDAPNLKW